MRILLAAINAKYIHTCLAVRSIKKYCEGLESDIQISEYTINQEKDFILSDLMEKKPDVVCFSSYIWNIEFVKELSSNIKKVNHQVKIILGGPEVSYDCEKTFTDIPYTDIIIFGEGERTAKELFECLENEKDYKNLLGIAYKENNKVIQNPPQIPLSLDELPFVYDDISELENRIIYYETSRGCPYNCQYCLSSVEKGVRFLSLERVFSDLDFFIKNRVKQVKFVDRTFNCNKKHAVEIWKYIIKNDNGYTNFHMEITADILDDSEIELLKTAREGLIQFEIGVQSTNDMTIEAVKRNTSFDKLVGIVKKIKATGNIHCHLDLIAGLPYEDFNSFKKSFNDVYALKPEQFQLGFLKLLKGSGLRYDAEKYGIVYRENPPYEVLYTKWLDFYEMTDLKACENIVETYYNSGKSLKTIEFAIKYFESAFDFYYSFGLWWKEKDCHKVQHSKIELYEILRNFLIEKGFADNRLKIAEELLRFDIYWNDNLKTLPEWAQRDESENFKFAKRKFFENKEITQKYFPHLAEFTPKQIARMTRIEKFELSSNLEEAGEAYILFDYNDRDIITSKAKYHILEEDELWT